jgi:hypothetical protein
LLLRRLLPLALLVWLLPLLLVTVLDKGAVVLAIACSCSVAILSREGSIESQKQGSLLAGTPVLLLLLLLLLCFEQLQMLQEATGCVE